MSGRPARVIFYPSHFLEKDANNFRTWLATFRAEAAFACNAYGEILSVPGRRGTRGVRRIETIGEYGVAEAVFVDLRKKVIREICARYGIDTAFRFSYPRPDGLETDLRRAYDSLSQLFGERESEPDASAFQSRLEGALHRLRAVQALQARKMREHFAATHIMPSEGAPDILDRVAAFMRDHEDSAGGVTPAEGRDR